MSNKTKIWDADRAIRAAVPVGMEQGTKLTIEYIVGFELFNTRAYHNYETWSTGYRITGPIGEIGGVIVGAEAEDLDDALKAWVVKRDAAMLDDTLRAWVNRGGPSTPAAPSPETTGSQKK